jgi:hypothetical protein
MKHVITYLLIANLLVACSPFTHKNKKTITIDGVPYALIRAAHTNSNGIVDDVLYEKKGDTNKYYRPSLDGRGIISLPR